MTINNTQYEIAASLTPEAYEAEGLHRTARRMRNGNVARELTLRNGRSYWFANETTSGDITGLRMMGGSSAGIYAV